MTPRVRALLEALAFSKSMIFLIYFLWLSNNIIRGSCSMSLFLSFKDYRVAMHRCMMFWPVDPNILSFDLGEAICSIFGALK